MARANEVIEIEMGVRLRFESSPGLLADIVEVTGPPGTRELLRSL